MAEDALPELLSRFVASFPEKHPLTLLPSAGGWDAVAERFSGGHAARWFAATDGQVGDRPSVESYAFCSLEDARATMKIADELRAQPEGYWVEAHWIAIASDGAGQHLMIDDRDGRVLDVAHDDDHVKVLGPSVDAWLQGLIAGRANKTITWTRVYGLIPKADLARIKRVRAAQKARREEPMSVGQRVGLALTVTVALVISVLVIAWLETHR